MYVGAARGVLFQAMLSMCGSVCWRGLPQNASGVVVAVLVQFDTMYVIFCMRPMIILML